MRSLRIRGGFIPSGVSSEQPVPCLGQQVAERFRYPALAVILERQYRAAQPILIARGDAKARQWTWRPELAARAESHGLRAASVKRQGLSTVRAHLRRWSAHAGDAPWAEHRPTPAAARAPWWKKPIEQA